jgi:hypothetical protein
MLPRLSKRAIRLATRASMPVSNIGELTSVLQCSRSTLWHAWHRTQRADDGRLEDFLDWLLLVHGVAWKRATSAAWEQVAARLRIDPATIRRIAKRQFGLRLRDVDSNAHLLLATSAVEAVLARHFGSLAWTNCRVPERIAIDVSAASDKAVSH